MDQRLLLLVSVLGAASALFEDQAFKFDWKQSFVGQVTDGGFYSSSKASVFVVATESHVVAGIDSDSGALIWRHAQEAEDIGAVRALKVGPRHAASVSGDANALFLRLWDPVNGALVVEHLVKTNGREPDVVAIEGGRLVLVHWDGGEVEVVTHTFDSKKLGERESRRVASPFAASAFGLKCSVTSELVLVCGHASKIHFLSLSSSASRWERQDVGSTVTSLRSTKELLEVVTEAGTLAFEASVQKEAGKVEMDGLGIRSLGGCSGIEVHQSCEVEGIDAEGKKYCRTYSRDLVVFSKEGQVTHSLAEDRGKVEAAWAGCEEDGWQVVLALQDSSLLSLTPRGNAMFLREEGLADIQQVQMVAIGLSERFSHPPAATGALLDPTRLIQSFISRIQRHVSQLQGMALAITDFRLTGRKQRGVVPDRFGLRKVVVVATGRGKLYGLDSGNGAVLWQARVDGSPKALHLQRDGRGGADGALACLVFKHHRSTHFVLSFNPVTGAVHSQQPVGFELSQALLLPETSDSSLRPILLVGRDSTVELLPSSATNHIAALPRLFVVTDRENEGLTGNLVKVSDSGKVSLMPVWTLESPGAKIIHVKTRAMDEKVHSAGRVMDDRSVLFKYMNPNLALIVAEGQDSASKAFITIQVVDLVTGRIFFAATHKKVAPPFHAVLSENWAVYTFFNEKARRTELVSLELYEGKTQGNSTMFSSIENTVVPLVERQAYILPVSEVASIKETITEKGITAKHLLVASSQGAILDLPLHMVDPRRPALNTPAHLREPGIPPYLPELPLPHESILNYNQTVVGVRGVTASPSGLESTVLVFVHGLDLYGTRIAPSKGFDLIKDDFEHFMIAGVLVFLVAASFGTRKLAQRKMLNQAWK